MLRTCNCELNFHVWNYNILCSSLRQIFPCILTIYQSPRLTGALLIHRGAHKQGGIRAAVPGEAKGQVRCQKYTLHLSMGIRERERERVCCH